MAPKVITMDSGESSDLKEAETASITLDCLNIRKFGVPESATAWIKGWLGKSSTESSSKPKRAQQAKVWATSIRSRSNLIGGWTNPFEKYAQVKLDHETQF